MARRVRESPRDVARLREADAAIHQRADLAAGIAIYRDVLRRFPDDAELLFRLGEAELTAGDIETAEKRLRKAVRLQPTPGAYRALAKVRDLQGDAEGALACVERGLALAPNDPALMAAKADALFVQGEIETAHELLSALLEGDAHGAVVLAFTRLCHRVGRVDDGIALLERALARPGLDPQQAAFMSFRLAGLLERQGAYDRAFDAAERANRLRAFPFDEDAFEARVRRAMQAWTREAMDSLDLTPGDTSRPILIVGMPRSGTSLVEQIVASHPSVGAGGERAVLGSLAVDLGAEPVAPPILESPERLSRQVLARASRRYLNDLRAVDPRSARVTDKMPTNFLNLGLAAAICPGAKIVHCIRDARDTCVSCYFQSFSDGLPFACDLAALARVSNAERRLMAHWKQTLDAPILDLVYEDLVGDPAGQSRRLIDFLGLDWDGACETFWQSAVRTATASVDQVRQPIYASSVGRWKQYESRLEPLLARLDAPGAGPTLPG